MMNVLARIWVMVSQETKRANPLIVQYENDLASGIALSLVLRHAKSTVDKLIQSGHTKPAAEILQWIDRKETTL